VTGISAPPVTGISVGDKFAVALGSDGSVWAWGDNTQGELGTGSPASVTGKVLVPGLSGVTQVSAGVGSSLAIHPALLVIHPA
jgi:hypothetical protein